MNELYKRMYNKVVYRTKGPEACKQTEPCLNYEHRGVWGQATPTKLFDYCYECGRYSVNEYGGL